MRLSCPHCPHCGLPAIGTVEVLSGVARIFEPDECGDTDYMGFTDVSWNSQKTNTNPAGEKEVICKDDHTWFTRIT